jgi:hypothetical protein
MLSEEEDALENDDSNDFEDNNEIKATKVEVGDHYVVVANEPKNGDPFFVVFCNKPLHRCLKTFNDGWGNTWYEGDIILGGIWYKRTIELSVQNPF